MSPPATPVVVTNEAVVSKAASNTQGQILQNFNDVTHNQCDKIGRFLKVLGTIFASKVAQKEWWLSRLFRKRSIYVNLVWLKFGQLLAAVWLLFYSNVWLHCSQRKGRKLNDFRFYQFFPSWSCKNRQLMASIFVLFSVFTTRKIIHLESVPGFELKTSRSWVSS